MIEKLTKAKLIEYGFDKTSIERLLKWNNYECLLGNGRGYFFASNIEGKIYSGKEGREKHFPPLRAKDKFETFEDLFDYVYSLGLIESDKENRKFYREAQKSSHRLNFNIWLQTGKGWEYGNETQYKENLTKQNWIEYIEFFKDEIKRKKADLEKEKQSWKPQQTETKTDKLKVNQIALIHVYEGIQITRENAGEIAAKHGYTATNSGEGLFQDYTNYGSTANRKGKPSPCTPKKLKNKIELFESVVNYLSDNNKQRAIDEIMILKTIFENEYQ